MPVYAWIKKLTMNERSTLAEEVKCTQSYLSFLASKKEHLSINLASNILNSVFNKKLPKPLRLTEEEYLEFRRDKQEGRL